jgi:hypothetical protein
MVEITEGGDGVGVMLVNYGGDPIQGGFNIIQRMYGYLENVLAGMAMMTELELSMLALRYEQRDGQRIVFQEPSIHSNKKMCIRNAKEEEQRSGKGEKGRGWQICQLIRGLGTDMSEGQVSRSEVLNYCM